eukprot:CAMPEP_0180220850 /NCGR_PEP_ID=MMETSP0987-20121128/19460_1 /TAXON_ID=697907 /ORGANISM="non described non described, Strain CCMP2293" /LENGTH=234 /DNA_ID=CAMNT_0022182025 /DNA_START=367 /DNA_END=1070 /DNA_ORIENTATION=+
MATAARVGEDPRVGDTLSADGSTRRGEDGGDAFFDAFLEDSGERRGEGWHARWGDAFRVRSGDRANASRSGDAFRERSRNGDPSCCVAEAVEVAGERKARAAIDCIACWNPVPRGFPPGLEGWAGWARRAADPNAPRNARVDDVDDLGSAVGALGTPCLSCGSERRGGGLVGRGGGLVAREKNLDFWGEPGRAGDAVGAGDDAPENTSSGHGVLRERALLKLELSERMICSIIS